ncbi:MAG: hypothetical protein K1X94_31010 [Sandaracinaceae bacterium]|nr:hypothetical protein [Sandaracinaceae bacterium]
MRPFSSLGLSSVGKNRWAKKPEARGWRIARWACLAFAAALWAPHAAQGGTTPTSALSGPRAQRLAMIGPRPLRAALIRAVERDASEAWHLTETGTGRWLAREDGAVIVGTPQGLVLRPARGGIATLTPRVLSRDGGASRALAAVAGNCRGNEAVQDHGGGVVERWVHGPLGLEHVVELASRMPGRGPLALEIEVSGALAPRLVGSDVTLVDEGGAARAGYGELWVQDADGHSVPARLEVLASRIRVLVDDAEARYPLTIDPLVWMEQTRYAPVDTSSNDQFGVAVSVHGDLAVVGAWAVDKAYLFHHSVGTWVLESTQMGASGSELGASVDTDGVSAILGAPGVANGEAWIMRRSGSGTWSRETTLAMAGLQRQGHSVAISIDRAVVGAPLGDSGGAAVYTWSGSWDAGSVLPATSADSGDQIGYSVDLDADRVVVGAPGDDLAVDQGSVRVFAWSGSAWTEEARLLASDGATMHELGWRVAISGDTVLAGTFATLAATTEAAYVFVRAPASSSWSQQARLHPSDAMHPDRFGAALALEGDVALVAAWNDRLDTSGEGSVYFFERTGTSWDQTQHVQASDPTASANFGRSVSLSGTTAFVGAPGVYTTGAYGALYIFSSACAACDAGPGTDAGLDAATIAPDAWSPMPDASFAPDAWSPMPDAGLDAAIIAPDAWSPTDADVPDAAVVSLDAGTADGSLSIDAGTTSDAAVVAMDAGPDAGMDAGREADAGPSASDAGLRPRPQLECTCRATGSPSSPPPIVLWSMLGVVIGAVRRRARPIALALVTAALVLSAGPAIASAQSTAGASPSSASDEAAPQDPEAQARALYEAGATHYREGRFPEAADSFTRAYELSPRPALLQNIYTARRDAGDLAGAAEALRRFLLEATDLSADERRLLNHRLHALEAQLQHGAGASTAHTETTEEPSPVVTPAEQRPQDTPSSATGPVTIAGWALVGVAGAAAIASAVGGGLMISERDGLYAMCNQGASGMECPSGVDVDASVSRFETARGVMWTGIGVGAAALTAAIVLLIVGDPAPADAARPAVSIGPEGASVGVSGRF